MKHLLRHPILILALAALGCSCTTDSTDVPETAEVLRFATDIVWPTDRAVTDKTAFTGGDKIGVFAYYQSSGSPDFMNNQLLSTTNGTEWTYSPVKYWPNNTGATLSLYAYSPYAGGVTMDTKGQLRCHQTAPTSGTSATFTPDPAPSAGSYAVDGNTDFLMAALPGQGKPAVGQAVTFLFHHALAKVRLSFAVGSGLTSATVTSVAFGNVSTGGTVSVADGVVRWSGTDATGTYTRTPASALFFSSPEAQAAPDLDTYLIPCASLQLTVSGTVTPEDSEATGFTKTVTLSDVTLQAGKTTTLNITLTPDAVAP